MAAAEPGNPAARASQVLDDDPSTQLPARHTGVGPFRTLITAESDLEPADAELPHRYEIRPVEERSILVCREAPGVAVSIEPDHAFSEVDARKLAERTILLDGAGTFGPLVDDGKNLYNLDHHEGCLRAFTLSTCEQALVMVLKGLELDKGDWTIYANEPDLDTVLAIWVLLNYRRVRELSPRARDTIVPLLRLEGAIDANGFEIAEHCGLPQERVTRERARIDKLFRYELAAKKNGWSDLDLASYTLEMLHRIDRMVYTSSDFSDWATVEQEHGHVSIGGEKVAVVCRDSSGIYEVEKRLKKLWGDRLGLIALERAANQYTLRLSAGLSGINLEDAYDRLNLLDPAVDGRPAKKRWGGSDDIGGSPRPGGTGLTPREIGKILKLTYQPAPRWHRTKRLATSVLWTVLLALMVGLGVFAARTFIEVSVPELAYLAELGIGGAIAGLGAWILTYRLSRGWTWLFGWRWPAGEDHLALVPAVLAGAAAGGVWTPRSISFAAEPLALAAGTMALLAVSLALWFPGLAHGLLVLEAEIQTLGGRWFVSLPALVAGLLYCAVTFAAVYFGLIAGPSWPADPTWKTACVIGGSFLVGVALAMMRERSLSLWPPLAALAGGCLVKLVADFFLAA